MSANPSELTGSKYITRKGDARRAHRTELSYKGVPLSVEYFRPVYLNPEDAYVEKICAVEIGHVDCTSMLTEEQLGEIAERIEQSWVRIEEAV